MKPRYNVLAYDTFFKGPLIFLQYSTYSLPDESRQSAIMEKTGFLMAADCQLSSGRLYFLPLIERPLSPPYYALFQIFFSFFEEKGEKIMKKAKKAENLIKIQ